MNSTMKHEPAHSREFEIDMTVEQLVGKLMNDALTSDEEARFKQLMAQRSRMMRQGFSRTVRRRVAA